VTWDGPWELLLAWERRLSALVLHLDSVWKRESPWSYLDPYFPGNKVVKQREREKKKVNPKDYLFLRIIRRVASLARAHIS